jgi:hypothetical protein
MDSPFPGMDPYLEQHWGDIHHSLITYARDQIQPRLPRDLRARVQERVVIEPPGRGEREIYPDVHVSREPEGMSSQAAVATIEEVEVARPLVVVLARRRTEGFVEIVEAGTGERVITTIEVLSPSNKRPGEGRDEYRRKLRTLKVGRVSLVEIDLLRAGKRGLAVPVARVPKPHRATYQVCVRRGWRPEEAEVYPAPLRERLPTIRIPLRESDADVPLGLQALLQLAYRNGRYDTIDYRAEPRPPLSPDDAAWADALLREKGRR